MTDRSQPALMRSAVPVAIVSAATLLLTAGWQLFIARSFGTSRELDAFWIALAIPRAIADSFHLGLLTLLLTLVFGRSNGDAEGQWHQCSAVLNVTILGTIAGIAVLEFGAPVLVRTMAPGFSAPQQALAAAMLRRLAPMLVATAVAAAIGGLAVARRQLVPFTLSRAAVPALQIAVLALVGRALGTWSLVWALWAGAVGSLLVFAPWLRRAGFTYRPSLGTGDAHVRSVLRLQLVMAVVWVLITLNQVSDRFFASLLGPGRVSALEFAWRFEVPIAQIVSLAVALPTFGLLAQSASPDRRAEFRRVLNTSARLLVLGVVPLLAFLVVLRDPLTRMWLARGEFSADAATGVAALLPSLAVVFFCRGFASILVFGLLTIGRTRLLILGLAFEVAANAALDAALSRAIGLPGIALASALSMLAVNGGLWAVLLNATGGLDVHGTFKRLRPLLAPTAVAVIGLEILRRIVTAVAPFGIGRAALVPIATLAVAYGALYVAACIAAGVIRVGRGAWQRPLRLQS